jgi:redox-sensitive bicupin YhaK (pirin superfamily)
MPAAEFAAAGGRMHGFQLWVNLPRRDKMMPPRYQEVPSERIPSARSRDGMVSVRVIAGEALGVAAVIETRTPIQYLDWSLQRGASISQPVGAEYNTFAYVVEGSGLFGQERHPGSPHDAVLFASDGDSVTIQAPDSALRVLLIAGVPLKEPVARYGPFVMNTRAEILQAMDDYQSGRLGAID